MALASPPSSLHFQPEPEVNLKHPEWSKNATIYQINTRQFTRQGTFAAAAEHLDRLKALNIKILWLMPVHSIGDKNKKGSLGSPYAVKDYYSVNPEFGTFNDFKDFVKKAHDKGFKVILDWVPNHTAWDSVLAEKHPEWFLQDWQDNFCPPPWYDWDDIIELNYQLPEVREYMANAMKYWLEETDIDGFRCDVAGFLPKDFWDQIRAYLEAVKPVFMLAEWEDRDLHVNAFDMTYGWHWYDVMHRIAKGEDTVEALHVYYAWNEKAFPRDAMRMLFVSNHDKNAWEGTEYEQFGDALEATVVLSVISEGMPLIYNGQEAGNQKRLAFFDKDEITWQENPYQDLYTRLFALKQTNTSLWNAKWGARMIRVRNTHPNQVLSFVRMNEQDKVFALFNFSVESQNIQLIDGPFDGEYTDFFTGDEVAFQSGDSLELPAWSYKVYIKA